MPNRFTELRRELRERIAHCIASLRPFALVRIPNSDPPFVFYEHPVCGVAPTEGPYFRIVPWDDGERGFRATSSQEYMKSLRELLQCISPEMPKVVFSRIIEGTLDLAALPDKAFRFFDAFPDTLGFLYFTVETGFWLGATPELLLSDDGSGRLSTMALAGTRPAGSTGDWDEKNLREHAWVVDFIVDVLRGGGVENLCVHPLATLPYGPVEHLCTRISASSTAEDAYSRIVEKLSPTPALCGTPRERARSAIERFEQHSRGCYGGYIDFRLPGTATRRAYANLRCARIAPDGHWTAFAGGGIVEGSEPETEWDETERKASRIVQILSEDE
ncbi:MAG: chorismate-binding protein [Muribaculaceae bacterium]|nr:chorismate-binding protein [Muribaculaceae bacterium]